MKNEKPKEIPEEEFFKIKNDKNLSKMKKRLDYKNTHFHNPVIQRHDLEAQKENGDLYKYILYLLFNDYIYSNG